MTACTEPHMGERTAGAAREGQKGMSKVAES